MAKRQSKTVAHQGKTTAPPPEEREGNAGPDVRAVFHGTPEDRPIRLTLRRGGAPVALSMGDAQAVIERLQEAMEEGR